jgi:ComF family protein
LVQAYKFGQQRAAAEPLAQAMSQVLLSSYSKGALKAQDYLIVPVPTATSRLRQRGFDHSALLAKLVARKLGGRFYPALGRLGQNRQLGTSRAQRLAQPAGHYFAKRSAAVSGRNILLIDDVLTTGGTLIECSRVLRAAGARHVDALVFAKKL